MEQIFGENDYFQRQRYIHYDTDNITEFQAEAVKKCSACSGFRKIYSRAEHYNGRVSKIGAVLLPWHACRNCRRAAEEAYWQFEAEEGLDHVYLLDPMPDSQ